MPFKYAVLSKNYPPAPDFPSSSMLLQMRLMREALECLPEGKELLARLGPEPKLPESGDTHPFVCTASARNTLMLCKFVDFAQEHQSECNDLCRTATEPFLLTGESKTIDRTAVLDWLSGRSREECADEILKLLLFATKHHAITIAREKYQLALNVQLEASAYREQRRNDEVDMAFEQAIQRQEEIDRLQTAADASEQRARQAENDLKTLSSRIDSLASDIRKECKSKKKDRKNADPVDRLESSIAMLKQYLAKGTTQSVEAPTEKRSRETELQKENDDLKQQLSSLRKLYDEEKLLVGEQSEELSKLRVAAKEAKKLEKMSKKN